ncbi:MAG: PilW family protein [Burkholderiales bacterium]|nr:PilW family protein [Burkholderiales bacterium]
MKRMQTKYSKGRTLIEVMIAMAIGLVISLAVTSLFVSNSQTYRIFDDKSLMEEDGRMALNILAVHVRQAGYGNLMNSGFQADSGGGSTDYNPGVIAANEAVRGCTGGFVSETGDPTQCNNTSTTPDAFLIKYVASGDNTNSVSASGVAVPTDCLGQTIASSASGTYIVENRFYVASNPSTSRRELYCAGNGGVGFGVTPLNAGQPFMENVVDMKITYGYDQQGTKSANSFFSAASLESPTVPEPMSNGALVDQTINPWETKWGRVVSAKICLVMRSANDNLTPAPTKYTDCSGTVVTATDKRLYTTFSTVVALRARASGRTL